MKNTDKNVPAPNAVKTVERKDGYYWVKSTLGAWSIARYYSKTKDWQVIGWHEPFLENNFSEINETRLSLPLEPLEACSGDVSKKNVTLQHDAHNEIDRLDNILHRLDKWNKEIYSPTLKNAELNLQNHAQPYIVAEYLRSHIKTMRYIISEYYKVTKELAASQQSKSLNESVELLKEVQGINLLREAENNSKGKLIYDKITAFLSQFKQ